MNKDLIEILEYKKKYLFISIYSECLKHLNDTFFYIPSDGSEAEACIKISVPYKIIMKSNLLKLASFERSGFFDEKYDVTFCYSMHYLLQLDYFVYDSDGLKKEEMSRADNLMKKVFRRKGKFEYGDEMLLERIDLNDSLAVMYYTKDAKKNIKSLNLNKKIARYDLIKDRSETLIVYEQFDKKIRNGKVREFQWN